MINVGMVRKLKRWEHPQRPKHIICFRYCYKGSELWAWDLKNAIGHALQSKHKYGVVELLRDGGINTVDISVIDEVDRKVLEIASVFF